MRLEFSAQKLYGRDRELAELQRVYDQIVQEGSSKLVLLEGYSGNGKTSLVSHFGHSVQHHHSNSSHSVLTSTSDDSPTNRRQDPTSTSQVSHAPTPQKTRFIKGKFDEQNRKPYAAFAGAFRELIDDLICHRHSESERIAALKEAVVSKDETSQVLNEIIPNLHNLLELDDTDGTDEEEQGAFASSSRCRRPPIGAATAKTVSGNYNGSARMMEKMHQFQFQVKTFVQAACSGGPLILFLDDLQWADMSSLELLKALTNDGSSHNLMIIGAYRGHEIEHNENHPLYWCIGHLKNKEYLRSTELYEMELSDFPLNDLNQFVADSLRLAPEKTLSLSQVVWQKTQGNVFYSKQFLEHLVEENLIRYDMTYYQWTWKVDEISGATDLSENVVEMVAARIRQLPPSVIRILKIASCLWYSFDVSVLEYIVVHSKERMKEKCCSLKQLRSYLGMMSEESRTFHTPNNGSLGSTVSVGDQSKVTQGLQAAAQQGLLDETGTHGFKFAHDRIREATYSLIQEGEERDTMHMVIGELLWGMFHDPTKSQQWMLFSSVDQLNKVSCQFKEDATLRLELAQVNLEAAECAIAVSAFLPAIDYLKSGIQLLGDNPWEDPRDYWLCLSLHSKLAALESSVGHTEESEKLIQDTLQHAHALDDKLPVYSTKVESLGVQGKLREALTLAFEVLEGLGEVFPSKTKGKRFERAVEADAAMTQKLLSRHNDASILSLPKLRDRRKQYALKLLNLMSDPAFHLGEMMQLFLIINRMVRISLEHGLGDASGVAFALYGFSLSSPNGDRRENYRYGQLALLVQERLATKEWKCRVLVFVYVMLNHWVEPLQKSLNPLMAAHSAGMQAGDIDYAFQAAGAFLTLYWYSGNDLNFGVNEMRNFCVQMKEYKQEKALAIYLPLFQCMLNMTGPSSDALTLAGEAVSHDELNQKKFTNSIVMSYQMQLAYYFNDMDLAEELSTKLQEASKSFNAHYLFVARQFFFGLIALRVAMDAKGMKRRRNIATAKRVITEMEQWTRRGGINCLQKLLILNAEQKALDFLREGRWSSSKESIESVRESYDVAITTAIRSGFRNDAALACERAAVFLGRCKQDTYWVQSYESRAVNYYTMWGANAKVDQLTATRSSSRAAAELSLSTTGTTHFRRKTVTFDHVKTRAQHKNEGSSHLTLSTRKIVFSSAGDPSLNDDTESVTNMDEAHGSLDTSYLGSGTGRVDAR